jgi:pilus assembly protein Flp/PilA
MTKIYCAVMSRLNTLKSKKGQTLVEYGLILALVSIVVIAVLTLLGGQLKNIFSKITSTLNAAN